MSPYSSSLYPHAIDSPVLGPVDSASVPSEPPDIRNWFTSYIYESPELNTLDGLQDFDGSGETCLQEGKKGISVDKSDDGLFSAGRKSLEKIIKFNELDEIEYSKYAALVTGSSESLSFSSEPPDIKSWFSSYMYESSPLDTTRDFTISDYKMREDGNICNAQKRCKQDNKDVDFIDVEESIELPSQSRIPNLVVKYTNMVEVAKLEYQPVDKDIHDVAVTPKSSIPSQLTSEKVSEQILPQQGTGNYDRGSVRNLGNTNTYGKGFDVKLDCSSFEGTIPGLSNMENNIISRDGKHVHKLTGNKYCVKNCLENEELHEIASPADKSIGKGNKDTELLENGFISIRKSGKENACNSTRPVQVQSESLKHAVKPALRCQKNVNISRKVLSEKSCFQTPAILESNGKWCCPQKNKPNQGPPLKQLRLERWVRRV